MNGRGMLPLADIKKCVRKSRLPRVFEEGTEGKNHRAPALSLTRRKSK